MSKSKATITEEKKVENDYYNDYSELLNVLQSMMQHCSNPRSEIFAQAQFLGVIARRKAYFDYLRQQVAEASKTGDTNKLSFLINNVSNAIDNKVCDFIWQEAADMYNNFINLTAEQEINETNARISFKTAEEIMQEAQKYYTESKEQKNLELVKQLNFLLDSTL